MKLKNIVASLALASTAFAMSSIAQADAQDCTYDELSKLDYRLVFFGEDGQRLKSYNIGANSDNPPVQTSDNFLRLDVFTPSLDGFEDIRSEVAEYTFVSNKKIKPVVFVESTYEYLRFVRENGTRTQYLGYQETLEVRNEDSRLRVTQAVPARNRKGLESLTAVIGCY